MVVGVPVNGDGVVGASGEESVVERTSASEDALREKRPVCSSRTLRSLSRCFVEPVGFGGVDVEEFAIDLCE